MKTKYFTAVLGLTSVIALNTFLPVQAKTQVHLLEVGVRESLELNSNPLDILEDSGLTVLSADSITSPAPEFFIEPTLASPSLVPGIRGKTLTFLYDDDPPLYLALGRTEEFSGSIVFDVGTDKLIIAILLILLMTFSM